MHLTKEMYFYKKYLKWQNSFVGQFSMSKKEPRIKNKTFGVFKAHWDIAGQKITEKYLKNTRKINQLFFN